MRTVKLAQGVTLPEDAVTQTFGIMARRGAGKTYCGQKLAEGMLDVGAQIVVLDPVGNWWGLRLAADGKKPGYAIPLLGGLRGDIPLQPTAGALVADVVADTGTSVILDVSQFRKGERKRFVADFCERLFSRRKREPSPTHVFLEEAQAFIPQRLAKEDTRMAGAVEDIVRLGRNFGLGATMISQRPQSVNKEVFNQVECLIMLQINGSHERKAVEQWVTYQGIDVAAMVNKLPSLKVGEAFIWSPQWLDVLKRVKIGPKRTFDSSATPKLGARKRERKLGRVDLAKIHARMEAVPEEARTLEESRAEVRKLRRELRAAANGRATSADTKAVREFRSTVKALTRELQSERRRNAKALGSLRKRAADVQKQVSGELAALTSRTQRLLQGLADEADVGESQVAAVAERSAPAPALPAPDVDVDSTFKLRGGVQTRMMTVIAQHPDGIGRDALVMMARASPRASTSSSYMSEMINAGWVQKADSLYRPTEAGVAGLGDYEELPTDPQALRGYWCGFVRQGGQRRMLEAIIDAGDEGVTRPEMCELAGISPSASTSSSYLSEIVKLGLVQRGPRLRAHRSLLGGAP